MKIRPQPLIQKRRPTRVSTGPTHPAKGSELVRNRSSKGSLRRSKLQEIFESNLGERRKWRHTHALVLKAFRQGQVYPHEQIELAALGSGGGAVNLLRHRLEMRGFIYIPTFLENGTFASDFGQTSLPLETEFSFQSNPLKVCPGGAMKLWPVYLQVYEQVKWGIRKGIVTHKTTEDLYSTLKDQNPELEEADLKRAVFGLSTLGLVTVDPSGSVKILPKDSRVTLAKRKLNDLFSNLEYLGIQKTQSRKIIEEILVEKGVSLEGPARPSLAGNKKQVDPQTGIDPVVEVPLSDRDRTLARPQFVENLRRDIFEGILKPFERIRTSRYVDKAQRLASVSPVFMTKVLRELEAEGLVVHSSNIPFNSGCLILSQDPDYFQNIRISTIQEWAKKQPEKPRYYQIADVHGKTDILSQQLENAIRNGEIMPGSCLHSAEHVGNWINAQSISPVSVSFAYRKLARKGLVQAISARKFWLVAPPGEWKRQNETKVISASTQKTPYESIIPDMPPYCVLMPEEVDPKGNQAKLLQNKIQGAIIRGDLREGQVLPMQVSVYAENERSVGMKNKSTVQRAFKALHMDGFIEIRGKRNNPEWFVLGQSARLENARDTIQAYVQHIAQFVPDSELAGLFREHFFDPS